MIELAISFKRLKRLVPASLLFIHLLLTPLSARADQNCDYGIQLYNQRRYAEAIRYLEASLKASPDDPFPMYYAALSYHQLKNFAKAAEFYQKLVQSTPDSVMGQQAAAALKSFPAQLTAKPKPSVAPPAPSPDEKGDQDDKGRKLTDEEADKLEAAIKSATEKQAQPGTGDQLPEQTTLYCTKDNAGLIVEAKINGHNIRMVVDTGCPGIIISADQLSDLGLTLPNAPTNLKAMGVTTDVTDQWIMRADVSCGTILRRNIPISLIASSATPLLGQTFFRGFETSIDANSGTIVLKRIADKQTAVTADSKTKKSDYYDVPFRFEPDGNRIMVKVEINGRPDEVIFDTGNAAASISFGSESQLSEVGLTIPDDAGTMTIRGIAGMASARTFNIDKMRLGPIVRENVDATYTPSQMERPIIGQPLFGGWGYTIDHENSLIHFHH